MPESLQQLIQKLTDNISNENFIDVAYEVTV